MSFFSTFTGLLSDDPALRLLQGGLLFSSLLVIFLLFFATRDILLRTRSFLYQFFCILLVALVPVGGFLLYLLIRPARTIKERELEAAVLRLTAKFGVTDAHDTHDHAKSHKKK